VTGSGTPAGAHEAAAADTNIIAALRLYDRAQFPPAMLITAVTLGELSYGPLAAGDPASRAGRMAVLQHAEATFDPLPYDPAAARLYGHRPGRGTAATQAHRGPDDRRDRGQLPLYTANPDDFKGAESLVEVVSAQARPNDL
jgi:hypothetical protein